MRVSSLIPGLAKLGLYPKRYYQPFQAITWTANAYTTVRSDLSFVLAGTTAATDRTLTLVSAATAGRGAVQVVYKEDTGLGALIVTDGTTTFARLRIKGQIAALVSDGANWTTDWREPHPPLYESGRWYGPLPGAGAPSAAAPAIDTLYAHLVEFASDFTLDALGVFNQAAANGMNTKFALYAANPANPGKPDGGVLLTSAAIALVAGAATLIGYSSSGLNLAVKRGFYWAVTKHGGTPVNLSAFGSLQAQWSGSASLSEAAGTSTLALKGYSAAGQTFANNFPTPFPASTAVITATVPMVCFKPL